MRNLEFYSTALITCSGICLRYKKSNENFHGAVNGYYFYFTDIFLLIL